MYLAFTLTLTPDFVNKPVGSSSKILYSGGLNRGIKKIFSFLGGVVSGINFFSMNDFILLFLSTPFFVDSTGDIVSVVPWLEG